MHKPVMRRERRRKGKEMKRKMMAAVLMMAMTAGVLGGCGNSTENNAKTDTNAQNNANTAEIKENANADVTEIANADGTVYKVGIVQYVDDASLNQIEKAIEAELDAKGAELGVTFDYADYTYNGQADSSTLNQIAADLVAEGVDVIIPIATPAAMIMQNATEDNQIPVVFSAVSDPVGAGLAKEDGSNAGNITGSCDLLPVDEQLKMIRKMLPDAKKIGILYTTSEANSVSTIKEYKKVSDKYGFEIVDTGINTLADVDMAAADLVGKVDCICNLTDNTVVQALQTVIEKANSKKIPVFGSEIEQVKAGCVAAMGIDYFELGKNTGAMAAKILKGEATAKDTEYIKTANSALYVNTEAADKIGMELDKDYIADAAETFTEITVE